MTRTDATPTSRPKPRKSLDSYGVAELLDVSVHTVRSWRKRGLGPPYFKFEGIVRYRVDDVLAYEEAGRRQATWQ